MPSGLEDDTGCPPWCEHEHLGEAADSCGFHHDGVVSIFGLDHEVVPGHATTLFVNVSLHTQASGPVELPLVELQDEHQTVALLTPDECLALSRALLESAGTIAGDYRVVAERLEATVQELEGMLRTWVPVQATRK